MSGEYESKPPTLFDLDALDQNSTEAAEIAEAAEFERVQMLPDYAEAMTRYSYLIQELNTDDVPFEFKAVNFLTEQAIDTVVKMRTDPTPVPEESMDFASRFFGASDTTRDAILAAHARYIDYSQVLAWAVTNSLTVAQAREAIAELRSRPKPQFIVDPDLKEIPLRGDDPFQNAFGEIDFKVEGDDDWPVDNPHG